MISGKYLAQGQVASSVPFDNTGVAYISTDVQAALTEIRQETVLDFQTTATTTNGTLTLSAYPTSYTAQFLTGTATGFSVVLPDATTLFDGVYYRIYNTTPQPVTIKDSTGATLFTLAQSSIGFATLETNTSAAGVWVIWSSGIGVANGITTYQLTSSTAFTTSSSTDVIITSFTLTPQSGTYAIWYNAAVFYTTTPKTHWWSIYKAGSQLTDSERSQDTAHSSQNMVDSTMTYASFNGAQTCDIRVRCDNTGSLTVNGRTLLMIRLGT